MAVFCVQNQREAFYALLYHNKKPQVPMLIILYLFKFYEYLILHFALLKSVLSLLHCFNAYNIIQGSLDHTQHTFPVE